ncbi:bifunctional 2-keto-4-hydroxyglutarate aldolase/2-keto-3-deoxy-6-phosphogluconate aldolase [Caldicellulosiruptor naganoensis]|uniref:Bifunctional 2-keto-4-hydroxyglutarate aldolase/2-keto-3-deoxy-6-phosphogluconate aldolase n=1 Tax=Caldicellulosiruptor naganoensis TaxID=29324 RepID=A0ABY7BEV2_9FIRM|nr:bifunctional 2-keto-4-hydroxyglutarate aldolase/2-keto-3-deoxy-6-phosphogluconate aldolase [Caldicellulosiruptor naganoensis]WAM31345.1 bifunctional 2-keto-4-hydroxyglutarate aldolase/2-keto-3-deoxy-6-phosphogluconate aldolase [Caldicellulosiruptor naganoensis]
MEKEQVLQRIHENGLVVVVRTESKEKALKITEACIKGGASAIEITFTVPHADEIIRTLTASYSEDEILIGAGTVLDAETARIAILAGAKFVVSPYLNVEMVKLCNRYRIASMPGAMTIKEVVEALECGADVVKIFPGELFGPKIIKAYKGPIPQARLMPTGGVDLDNVDEWMKAGAFAVGVGSNITKYAANEQYDKVEEVCRQFVEKINNAKGKV